MTERITSGSARGRKISFILNGRAIEAYEGETIATALLAQGVRIFTHDRLGAPRGPFCGMGVCHDCLVTVINAAGAVPVTVRSCMSPVVDGAHVTLSESPRS